MFCLKRRNDGVTKIKQTLTKDDFGWWLSNEDDIKSPVSSRSKDSLSVGSSESMLSCIDSDNDESYSLAQEFRQEQYDNCERIELTSLIHEDLDVDLIEEDAVGQESITKIQPIQTAVAPRRICNDVTPFPAKEAESYFDESESRSHRSQGMCYTPERLVRSQEYRILTPSPRYLSISQARIMPENENQRKALRCRRRLNYLIDSKQVDTSQLKTLLRANSAKVAVPTIVLHNWTSYKQSCDSNDNNTKTEGTPNVADYKKSSTLHIQHPIDKESIYERLSVTWENCKKTETRSSSLEDTSGIQSNDWSLDTHSDIQNTPLCLFDELASTNYKLETSQERCTAINEVVSILEVLDTNPEKAAVLLDEDRFCNSTSSHDQLTRLALAIETDAKVSGVHEKSENLINCLQKKVEKLQTCNKDIYRDICDLRTSFQRDERKMADISSSTNKLHQDIRELRYLDDLLNLLRGEIEIISKRNWPFVIGRPDHRSEEINLIV